jgi:hypothetical protein
VYAVCVWLLDISTRTTYIVIGAICAIAVISWFIPKKKSGKPA